MNTLINNAGKIVKRGAIAGTILAASASAWGAVPEAPMIDWVDVTEQESEKGELVEVAVGWSRYFADEAASVQVRLDGKPTMTRALHDGQYMGKAEVAIEREGSFDLTVAFCNVEGCEESSPVNITVTDEFIDWSYENKPIDTDLSALQQDSDEATTGAEVEQTTFFTQGFTALPATTTLASGFAIELGKAALSGIVKGGADFGFQALLKHLGLGDEDFGGQIEELNSSVQALGSQITNLTNSIKALTDQTAWQGFITQHTLAKQHVNTIYSNFEDIVAYIDQGVEPDLSGWTDARTAVAEALEKLTGSITTSGDGIIDGTDGAIYQLMTAVPQRVASVESYWPIIEEYRSYYRTAVAIGFLSLDLIADNFDETGTTRIKAENALLAGQFSVLNMYAYGVAYDLPVSGNVVRDFVQSRSSTTGFAAADYADLDSVASVEVAANALRDAFNKMADDYDPEHHDGLTLEAFLKDLGVPTAFVLENADGFDSTGWQRTRMLPGYQWEISFFELKPMVGQVKGNTWTESFAKYCPSGASPCEDPYDYYFEGTESQLKTEINKRKNAIKQAGGYTLNNGTFAASHYAAIDLTDRLNHAGRPANLDEDAIWNAAFGDDSAKLAHGFLPGAESDGECIGLPEKNVNLLDVDGYKLRWQPDGKLLLVQKGFGGVWGSGTQNKADQLCWQSDGNLVIYEGSTMRWSSNTADSEWGGLGGRTLKLQQDGRVQIVNELSNVIWQIKPYNY